MALAGQRKHPTSPDFDWAGFGRLYLSFFFYYREQLANMEPLPSLMNMMKQARLRFDGFDASKNLVNDAFKERPLLVENPCANKNAGPAKADAHVPGQSRPIKMISATHHQQTTIRASFP